MQIRWSCRETPVSNRVAWNNYTLWDQLDSFQKGANNATTSWPNLWKWKWPPFWQISDFWKNSLGRAVWTSPALSTWVDESWGASESQWGESESRILEQAAATQTRTWGSPIKKSIDMRGPSMGVHGWGSTGLRQPKEASCAVLTAKSLSHCSAKNLCQVALSVGKSASWWWKSRCTRVGPKIRKSWSRC